MRDEVYWIPAPWPGRLGIAAHPRGGDWLDVEARAWREAGVDVVVSLLTSDEVEELLLQDEEPHCRQEGLDFQRFPIPDRDVPASRAATVDFIASLEGLLASGKNIVAHCRQGIGRSSLLAASLLVANGAEPGDAFHTIERARGRPVPDTTAQMKYVEELASDLRTARHPG